MQIRNYGIAMGLAMLFMLQSACANEYNVVKVTDGVFYHQGVHEDASAENIGAIANVGFIIGERCVAIIDSGGSQREGELLKAALKRVTDKPVCYVINTHVHPDHILGNAAFMEYSPTFIGHEKLPAALLSRQEFYQRVFSESLGDAYQGTEFISPQQTVSVDSPLTLDLGNRELTLTAYTTSHTDHDLTVLDTKTQTLWTGDLLFMERIPVVDGSINGWINNIEKLQQLEVNYVVPGHGTASKDLWQQGWQKQLDYLTTIRQQIRDIINDLGTIDEATSRVGTEQHDNWKLFDEYHRRNVTASFVELEWE